MQRTRPYKATPFKPPARKPSLKLARTKTFQLARSRSTGPFWGLRGSNFEKKFLDTFVSSDITTDVNPSVTPINLLAAGTDANQRIGRKVEIKSIQVRSDIKMKDVGTAQFGRFMLVYDKQTNGATPALTDILDTGSSPTPTTALLNINNRDRFAVLYDDIIEFDNVLRDCYANKVYKKGLWEEIFKDTGGTIASVTSGALYWVTVGEQTNASAHGLNQATSIRIRYIDA